MANLSMINQKNKASGKIEVKDCILETPYHPKAVKQAVLSCLASKRSGTHSTKTRSEVFLVADHYVHGLCNFPVHLLCSLLAPNRFP